MKTTNNRDFLNTRLLSLTTINVFPRLAAATRLSRASHQSHISQHVAPLHEFQSLTFLRQLFIVSGRCDYFNLDA